MPGDTPQANVNRDPTKTSSSIQVVKLTALHPAQFRFRYSPIFSFVLFNPPFPEVKYQESRGGSSVKPYIQEINCCCHPCCD